MHARVSTTHSADSYLESTVYRDFFRKVHMGGGKMEYLNFVGGQGLCTVKRSFFVLICIASCTHRNLFEDNFCSIILQLLKLYLFML